MCLIAIAFQCHSHYPLIVVANRDEFYDRPTLPAGFWHDSPELLAGRDQQAGGTWLGINKNGRFAAITNYREGKPPPAPRSRGELTINFLTGNASASEYGRLLKASNELYNGYSLLLYDGLQLVACSNRHQLIKSLSPGLYGLSNHLLDTPWPKVVLAKDNLKALLKEQQITAEQLMECLSSKTPFSSDQLPNTGLGPGWERSLSPPFVNSQEYGTRCCTTLLVSDARKVVFSEQSFERGKPLGEAVKFEFEINP